MREILFKCWIPSEKFMGVPFNPFEDFKEDDKPSKWRDDSIFLQFTGLKDKNSNDVYENDIIKDGEYTYKIVWAEYTERGDLDSDTFIVGWVREWRDGQYSPLGYSRGFQGEVIGNSFQNPELLKP